MIALKVFYFDLSASLKETTFAVNDWLETNSISPNWIISIQLEQGRLLVWHRTRS